MEIPALRFARFMIKYCSEYLDSPGGGHRAAAWCRTLKTRLGVDVAKEHQPKRC